MLRRRLGTAGRVVLPMEMLEFLGLRIGDYFDVTVEDDRISIYAVKQRCEFCLAKEHLHLYKDRYICTDCAAAVTEFAAADESTDDAAEDICTLMDMANEEG